MQPWNIYILGHHLCRSLRGTGFFDCCHPYYEDHFFARPHNNLFRSWSYVVAAEQALSSWVFFLNAPELIPIEQNEEHLVMEAGTGHRYKVGDILYGVPGHICPTVALYEKAYTVDENRITGAWQTDAGDRRMES